MTDSPNHPSGAPVRAGIDRNLALELVRATEAAALAASRHLGRGDKEIVDQAAVDAMRPVLNTISMRGTVVIGEGEKDEAPMLYNGEDVGDGTGPEVDFAVDPVDGTTLTAKSLPNALAIVAVSERHTMFDPGPCVYMEKIACAGDLVDVVDLADPVETTLAHIAKARGVPVPELTVCILDRPRHEADLVRRVREAGSRIKFLLDGDVAGAIMAATPDTNVDLMIGIGGTPEGVLAACALKCLGGTFYGKLYPRNDDERRAGPGRGLRPRQGPHAGRHGAQQQRLRRRHGRHGRRAAARGAVLAGPGDDALAVDALAVGRGAPDRDPAPDQHLEPRPEVRPLVMS